MDGKVCTKCRVFHPFSKFAKRKAMRDGHDSNCNLCVAAKAKLWREANMDRAKETQRNYREKHREKIDARVYAWKAANPERARAIRKKWRDNNHEKAREIEKASYLANREATLERKRTWQQANKPRYAAYANARRAAKLNATPTWVDESEILAIYEERERMQELAGVELHVDHIVPLISDKVCGLHVPWNLRIITGLENRQKSNKLDQDSD